MPYSVDWYIKDEITYTRYYGKTTGEELRESLLKSLALIEASPRRIVHSIIDVGDVVEQVPLKESMSIVREVGINPRAGWSLTIRERSHLIKMTSALGASIFKLRYRAFSTLEQAMAHLKNFDQNISWDKVEEKYAKSSAA